MYAQQNEVYIGNDCCVDFVDCKSHKVEKTVEGPFSLKVGQILQLNDHHHRKISNILMNPDNGETFLQFWGGKEIVIVEQ